MRKLIIALTIFLVSSCAGLTGNMNILDKDVKNLKEQVSVLNQKLQEATTKLSKLEGQETTVNTINALRESQADINSKFTKLSQELKHLSGRIDENKYNTGLLLKDSSVDRDTIKAQLGTLENKLKELQLLVGNLDTSTKYKIIGQDQAAPQAAPQAIPQASTNKLQIKDESTFTASAPSVVKDTANVEGAVVDNKNSSKALYESALKDSNSGFYKASRDKLYKLIKDEPKGAYAEVSNFLIADTLYKEGSFEDAIIQYEEVLKKYPKSKTLPEALLKQGLSFIQLGGEQNIGTAKLIFKQLITKYSKSKEAVTAKDKLDELTPKPKVKKKAASKKDQ
jgi:TolA-binding protein